MIRYSPTDQNIIQVVDATGAVTRSVPIWDVQNFTALDNILQKQQDAVRANNAAETQYLRDLNVYNYNTAFRIAQTGPAPTKPLMTLVDDSGDSTQVPFSPPLPDPLPPPPLGPSNPGGALVAQTGLTQDQKLDNLLTILTAIAKKVLSA